jgi:hypothetical protein
MELSVLVVETFQIKGTSELSRRLSLRHFELTVEVSEVAIAHLVSDQRDGLLGIEK